MPMIFDPPAAPAAVADASVPASTPLIGRVERMALLVACLLIGALHAVNLFFAGPLWRDEVGDAVYAAMPSWGHIGSMLKYDNFPLLLLVLLRTWRALGLQNVGGPDFGYRVYGLGMGLAILGALWFNARALGGRRNAPWFSLGLFAAGGLAVRVGDSIRPYGPGWLFMLLSFGLIWRVVQRPRAGRIALAAVAAVLSVQSLYQNAFLLLAIGTAGMLVAARAGRWRAAAAVAGIGALAAVSLVPYALGPVHDANAWSMVSRTGLTWGRMLTMLWEAAGSLDRTLPFLWPVAAGMAAAAVFALRRIEERDADFDADADADIDAGLTPRDVRWYALGSVAIVFPVFLGFLKLLGMNTTPWYYLLPLALAASALDAVGGIMARDPRWRAGRLAFLAVALGVGLPFAWQVVQVRVTNADVIAAQVGKLARPGDCVLVCPWTYGVSFDYYYHGETPWTTLPPLADNSIHRYDLMKERIVAADPIAPVLARLGETLRAGHRVWLVGWIDAPPEGQPPPVLKPAPGDPRAGWDEATYMLSWALQVGDYLRAHALRATDAPRHLDQKVATLEDLKLYCVQGWQP